MYRRRATLAWRIVRRSNMTIFAMVCVCWWLRLYVCSFFAAARTDSLSVRRLFNGFCFLCAVCFFSSSDRIVVALIQCVYIALYAACVLCDSVRVYRHGFDTRLVSMCLLHTCCRYNNSDIDVYVNQRRQRRRHRRRLRMHCDSSI